MGLFLLLGVAALVFFGLTQRILDRMRLTDTQALLIIVLMIAGSYITLPLFGESRVNVGGALVPLGLILYLLIRAGTARERWRAVLAAVASGIAVTLVNSLFEGGPHGAGGRQLPIDPLWLSGIVAGLTGYLAGRSRRASFIAGVGGVLLSDLYMLLTAPSPTVMGGAGIFDQVVIAGVIAVGLAELIGESRERLQGGPNVDPDRPLALHQDEGVQNEDGQREDGGNA